MKLKEIVGLLFSVVFLSCSGESESKKIDSEEAFTPISFFNFTQVDHYSIEISELEIWNMENTDSGQVNYEFYRILSNPYPANLDDTAFIAKLEPLGYEKKKIPPSKHKQLDSLFSEKKHVDSYYFLCMPEYRDILVFRDNNDIVGIAKICFSCDQSHILGAKADTREFGMSGDFAKLGRLLYE
jgi:hypothetical protein